MINNVQEAANGTLLPPLKGWSVRKGDRDHHVKMHAAGWVAMKTRPSWLFNVDHEMATREILRRHPIKHPLGGPDAEPSSLTYAAYMNRWHVPRAAVPELVELFDRLGIRAEFRELVER